MTVARNCAQGWAIPFLLWKLVLPIDVSRDWRVARACPISRGVEPFITTWKSAHAFTAHMGCHHNTPSHPGTTTKKHYHCLVFLRPLVPWSTHEGTHAEQSKTLGPLLCRVRE